MTSIFLRQARHFLNPAHSKAFHALPKTAKDLESVRKFLDKYTSWDEKEGFVPVSLSEKISLHVSDKVNTKEMNIFKSILKHDPHRDLSTFGELEITFALGSEELSYRFLAFTLAHELCYAYRYKNLLPEPLESAWRQLNPLANRLTVVSKLSDS